MIPPTLWPWLVALALLQCGAQSAAEPTVVRILRTDAGFQLERDGRPFFIKGAVGRYRLDMLEAYGGNSVRTGLEGLDEAQRHGLTCLVGLPLGNPRHGFDYGDTQQVEQQFKRIRDLVRRYRAHPALLIWSIGNEPEINTTSDQRIPLWREVNRIAEMVKHEDPAHPVIAVIGGSYRRILRELDAQCPALDAVGLNSYVDMLTLPEDVARGGWVRPYVITEFGPRGHWQAPKTAWRVPIEDTSTEKAAFYERAYRHAVEGRGQCLGAYAFYWSHKQEKTHTWYGMFLPDGSATAAVETMALLWNGEWPTNRCPRVGPGKIRITDMPPQAQQMGVVLMAGKLVNAQVDVSDPDGDKLTIAWDLRVDTADNPNVGGDYEPPTAPLKNAVVATYPDNHSADVRIPRQPGKYRLFVYAYDGRGHSATANLPILVAEIGQ